MDCDRIWTATSPVSLLIHRKEKSVKGQRATKLRFGAGRENITVLAVCSASGVVLNPMIVFKGKNMQQSWFEDKALPNTYYGKYENGWMETDTFAEWFDYFVNFVTDRPLLLLPDGQLTHVSIQVIRQAIEENIVLLKFPLHVTDVMQPLDVSCFRLLKHLWEKRLHQRINEHGIKNSLTKSEFVNELCGICTTGMKSENAISGFVATGI